MNRHRNIVALGKFRGAFRMVKVNVGQNDKLHLALVAFCNHLVDVRLARSVNQNRLAAIRDDIAVVRSAFYSRNRCHIYSFL